MENTHRDDPDSIKWYLFILGLALVHFFVAVSLLKMAGIVNSGVFLAGGGLWIWFLMPKVNAWMVLNTPFGKVWEWAKREI